jgi:hypothetical protein
LIWVFERIPVVFTPFSAMPSRFDMETVFLRATVLMIGPAIGVYLMMRRLGIFKF